jgi:hypothetical protein
MQPQLLRATSSLFWRKRSSAAGWSVGNGKGCEVETSLTTGAGLSVAGFARRGDSSACEVEPKNWQENGGKKMKRQKWQNNVGQDNEAKITERDNGPASPLSLAFVILPNIILSSFCESQ